MKYKLEPRKISKKDFYNLDENDLMFITNPGRMGDEDGSTFVLKIDDSYIPYRVNGWMYSNKNERNSKNYISLDDMFQVFPKWKESWHNYYVDKEYNGKYIYIYMGFGNGLCVDKRIYKKYYSYLLNEIKDNGATIDVNDKYDPSLNFSLWDHALIKMIINEMNTKTKKYDYDDTNIDFEFYKIIENYNKSKQKNSDEIEIPNFLKDKIDS